LENHPQSCTNDQKADFLHDLQGVFLIRCALYGIKQLSVYRHNVPFRGGWKWFKRL